MVRKGWFVSIKLSEQQLAFLSETRFGVLATVNADGSPQQTVMWYLPVDNRTILMNTKKRRVKDKNLERDPRVSLLVEDGQRYVAVRGRISVDDDATRGQETMRTITTRYEGAETAARQMEELYSKQHRITLTLDIESIDTHGFDE
ncbi:MAG: PPOX class F420-dependent oxidoreductase [Thermomicrobiales bacterium]|nr:PPOX class F420-dependent oxidoreductase [Thermomicrobiales bacterium]